VDPDRIAIAQLPTPLRPLPRLSKRLGVEVMVKRDDLTGAALSGNKVRKLEYLLADARAHGADTVITCGGAQSNHCRATAVAARELGMSSVLLLRTEDPARPPPVDGNILLDRLVGAELRFISRPDYARRAGLMRAIAEEITGRGGKGYVIPEGGSNRIGAWGYVSAVAELAHQLPAGARPTLLYACGSGGTGAGLILGCRRAGLDARVVGVCVCDDGAYFRREIGAILEQFQAHHGQLGLGQNHIEILEGYVGRGYALSRPEELTLLCDLAREEGLLLDPVYTGKAMYALCTEQRLRPGTLGERIVFLHTGGIFSLLAADRITELGFPLD
jgi:D-cysteine desulfhydrase